MNQEQEPNQIALTSPDGKEARLAELRRLFPDLFDGEGALDEKALRQLVSDEAGHITERFRFEWAGKAQSKRFAFAPSKATLVYDPERSVNADGSASKSGESLQENTSQNLIVEGDNLEVLAHSGTSGHPFRSHPATCSDVFGHLWRVAVRQRVSGIRSEAFRHPFWRWFCAWTRLRVRGGRHCGRCGRGSHRRTSARR